MILIVDGKAIPTEFEGETTLAALLHHVATLPEFRGRVITHVVLNGVTLESWDDESLLPIPPASKVQVSTRPVKKILLEAAVSCRDYLPRLMEGCVSTAVRLQQGQQGEALAAVQEIIDGLQWYNAFLGHVVAFSSTAGDSARHRLAALRELLEELLAAMQQQDFTLLADLFEYELVPELQSGFQFVDSLVGKLLGELES